jgi:hypothetical protein
MSEEDIKEQSFENESECSEPLDDIVISCESNESNETSNKKFKIFGYEVSQIKWTNVIWLIVIHSLAIYAYIHALLNPVKIWTLVFVSIIAALSGFGMRFISTFFLTKSKSIKNFRPVCIEF